MANAAHDDNSVPTLIGVSSSDGTTPTRVYVDPSTHRMLTTNSTLSGPVSSTDNALVRWDGTTGLTVQDSQIVVGDTGLVTTYGNVVTAGQGVPSIYGYGRSTDQTAAVASVATYTVGASDGTFLVAVNANVTAYTAGNFAVQVSYTDETGASITANIQGHFTSGYTATISGAGAFEGQPLTVRAKAATAITVKTAGTFTNLTYNVEGSIIQIA